MAKRTTGVVRWFDGSKGYGYIDAKDGEDVFVYYKAISGDGGPILVAGDEVEFLLEYTFRGAQANDVVRRN